MRKTELAKGAKGFAAGLLVALLLLLAALPACSLVRKPPHSRWEAKAYLNEVLPDKNFVLSQDYQEVKREDKYVDHIWEVYYPGKEELVFHVKSQETYGMEHFTRFLSTDFDAVYSRAYYNSYDFGEAITRLEESVTSTDNPSCTVQGEYGSLAELAKLGNGLAAFEAFVGGQQYPCQLSFGLVYNSAFTVAAESGEGASAIKNAAVYADAISPEFISAARLAFAKFALEHQIMLSEFGEEELRQVAQDSGNEVTIYHPDKTSETYPDILYWNSALSFGGMYEVLKRNGFAPSGTPQHYRFVGSNGKKYEFSYEFSALPAGQENHFYYLAEGARQSLDTTYAEVDNSLFEHMTGLRFLPPEDDTGSANTQNNLNVGGGGRLHFSSVNIRQYLQAPDKGFRLPQRIYQEGDALYHLGYADGLWSVNKLDLRTGASGVLLSTEKEIQDFIVTFQGDVIIRCKEGLGKEGSLLEYPLISLWLFEAETGNLQDYSALYDLPPYNEGISVCEDSTTVVMFSHHPDTLWGRASKGYTLRGQVVEPIPSLDAIQLEYLVRGENIYALDKTFPLGENWGDIELYNAKLEKEVKIATLYNFTEGRVEMGAHSLMLHYTYDGTEMMDIVNLQDRRLDGTAQSYGTWRETEELFYHWEETTDPATGAKLGAISLYSWEGEAVRRFPQIPAPAEDDDFWIATQAVDERLYYLQRDAESGEIGLRVLQAQAPTDAGGDRLAKH